MREKNYNTGLRGVLFEAGHYARMGSAIWLYGWLVLRQTHQTGAIGWVLGGAPVTYREIEAETGFNPRTLERWMSLLRRNAYIATEVAPGGVIVRILKAKKHLQGPRLGNPADVPRARKVAETVRRVAGGGPHTSVACHNESEGNERFAERIGSSSVGRIKEKAQQEIHRAVEILTTVQADPRCEHRQRDRNQAAAEINHCERREFQQQFREALQNHDLKNSYTGKTTSASPADNVNHSGNEQQSPNQIEKQNQRPDEPRLTRPPTQNTFPWQLRERMRLLRAERDDAVRRELAVGTSPEVRRP
jgi:hypothetical protein